MVHTASIDGEAEIDLFGRFLRRSREVCVSLATSYDDGPYPRLTFPYTHPSHLAVIGRLLGLRPAAVDRCRVLEFGCAGGGNLVPMAYTVPQSRFVGVDLSARQIADARAMAAAVGLSNATFEQLDILQAAESLAERFGEFDYIIAHGLYSWVPDPVKDALLAACRRLLAPEGIAYVSYNCFPGCTQRDMLRRMCQYHGRRQSEPRQYAAETRRFLESLQRVLPMGDGVYRDTLREQAAGLAAESDVVLLHDDLERDNDPRFFHQFMAHAAGHRLQYLGDAHFGQMFGVGIAPAALEKIRAADDVLAFEQYLDFLYGRALRTTLLCRAEARVNRDLAPDGLKELWITSLAAPRSPERAKMENRQVEANDGKAVTFRAPDCTLEVTTPIGRWAIYELHAAHPRPLRFDELLARVRARLPADDSGEAPDDERQLAKMVIEWFAMRLVELHAFEPPLALAAGEQPVASAVARYQLAEVWNEAEAAEKADQEPLYVSNLFLRRVQLGPRDYPKILSRLDGEHDRESIVDAFAVPFEEGRAEMSVGGRPITDMKRIRQLLAEQIENCLTDFARNALLMRTAEK